jgi:single-strand DNA-binding protein
VSFNYNRVNMAGNLGRDPEMKFLPNDKACATFSLAINRKWKDAAGQPKEDTTWVDVEAWGRTAELVGKYMTKGSACFIEGRLKLDTWDDKKTGEKRSKLKVVAESVQFIGTRGDRAQGADGAHAAEGGEPAPRPAPAHPAPATAGDDEPPF